MVPIKIQCGCGQRYSFEVEPVGGQVPAPVACPACGADGTAAANAALAQHTSAQPAAAPVTRAPLRVAAPAASHSSGTAHASGRPGPARLPGQIEPEQAEHEARAKILWGDPPEAVLKYLMIQGFSYEEASELVGELFRERLAAMRSDGIKKIVLGAVLICVPIASYLFFLSIGVIPLKLFAVTILLGLWGVWMAIKGVFMLMAPKSQLGDVAEQ